MDVIQEVEIGCRLKTPHLDKLTPSETTFDLDEVDETIGVAGDVPRWPCLAFRVHFGLGKREEAKKRLLVKHITDDDAAPEIDPSYRAFSERDHLVGLGWQVPWQEQDNRDGRLQLQVFGAPLVRLRREDVQAVVAPKVLTRSGTKKLASSRGTMARNYGRRLSCAIGEHVRTARHGFRMGACAVFSTRGVNCTCACM